MGLINSGNFWWIELRQNLGQHDVTRVPDPTRPLGRKASHRIAQLRTAETIDAEPEHRVLAK